jgi:hypothetical protein
MYNVRDSLFIMSCVDSVGPALQLSASTSGINVVWLPALMMTCTRCLDVSTTRTHNL